VQWPETIERMAYGENHNWKKTRRLCFDQVLLVVPLKTYDTLGHEGSDYIPPRYFLLGRRKHGIWIPGY
jgi:hypothetical protein